jgi:N-acetylglucosaminyl-diphospho-decaprenol L-rhamnosyltransferase
MESSGITITAIVISYNTCSMTLDCLASLRAALKGISSEVIVVDNDSKDGSVAAIREKFPEVNLIESKSNSGFGAANNLAMRLAKGEYFLLLNSDAFPEETSIATLLAYLREHPLVGVVGPRLLNGDGSLQVSCHPFPSPLFAWRENLWLSTGYSRWAHDTVRSVDFLIGACLLVRSATYEEVGGFDETFFMYSEEADWERRMRDMGWDRVFVPDARVTHLGGASGAKEEARVRRHFFESLDHYERKHHGLFGLIVFRMAMVTGCAMRSILWAAISILPPRREQALAKARKHSQLCLRQAFHWST